MAGGTIGADETREVLKDYYLEVPVLAKWLIGLGDMGRISLYAGPDLLIKVADFTRTDTDGNVIETLDQDIFNPLVFNAVFGIDYSILLGPGRAYLDVRYNLGITPVYDGDEVDQDLY